MFLWLRFALCLGTDSTPHFLGLWDRLLLQHSFLPPNTYLNRNHFFCSHIPGTAIYLNFPFDMKEIIKIHLDPSPLRDRCLLTPNLTSKAYSMSLTLLFLGRTSAFETEETSLKPWAAWERKGMGEKRSSPPRGGVLICLKKGIKTSDRGFSTVLYKWHPFNVKSVYWRKAGHHQPCLYNRIWEYLISISHRRKWAPSLSGTRGLFC